MLPHCGGAHDDENRVGPKTWSRESIIGLNCAKCDSHPEASHFHLAFQRRVVVVTRGEFKGCESVLTRMAKRLQVVLSCGERWSITGRLLVSWSSLAETTSCGRVTVTPALVPIKELFRGRQKGLHGKMCPHRLGVVEETSARTEVVINKSPNSPIIRPIDFDDGDRVALPLELLAEEVVEEIIGM